MFTLIIEDKNGGIADEYSFEEGEFSIGRSHVNDIILPSDNVSRRHARLYTSNGKCFIEDLNSSNGVYVNGKRILETSELGRSSQIKIGDYFLYVEGSNYEKSVEEKVFCRLLSQNFGPPGTAYAITKPVTLIGRGKDCTLTIVDPSVSRIHSKIIVDKSNTIRVEDLKSSNATWVNGRKIEQTILRDRDLLRFGNVEFMVEIAGARPEQYPEPSMEPAYHFAEQPIPHRRSGGGWLLVALLVVLIVGMLGGIAYLAVGDKLLPKPEETPAKEEKTDDDWIKKREEQVAAFIKKGNELLENKSWAAAQAEFQKALDIDTTNQKARQGKANAIKEARNQKILSEAVNLLKEDKIQEAKDKFKEIPQDSVYTKLRDSKLEELKSRQLETLIKEGDEALDERKYGTAHQKYVEAAQLKPPSEDLLEKINKVERLLKKKRKPYTPYKQE